MPPGGAAKAAAGRTVVEATGPRATGQGPKFEPLRVSR